jgi:cysteinyl-tRNA synthetase
MKPFPLMLYNTRTRQKEKVVAQGDQILRMYTCGPTVYNLPHIGNYRTFVFEDFLRRTLRWWGFSVRQVMNLTDVDDKTIRGALAQDLTLEAFTTPYVEGFFEDLEVLHIEPVEIYPRATDHIHDMIAIIQTLLERHIAYVGLDGSVYFAIDRFPAYGALSRIDRDALQAGASTRIQGDEYDKEHIADFALWKKHDPERDGTIYWDSPFGPGRPGWHIECSAMALKLLGETIDIHVGGVDNMFPHHENEIAQSEAYTGHPFVRHWVHVEHLLVDHKKMSKSLGNFYTLRDILKRGYTGEQIRFVLLQAHYRSQLQFRFEALEAAGHALQRLASLVARLRSFLALPLENSTGNPTENSPVAPSSQALHLLQQAEEDLGRALADDLNTSAAFAALFDFVRDVHSGCDARSIVPADARALLDFLERCNALFAFIPLGETSTAIPSEVLAALEKREQARKAKQWKEADDWRAHILMQGFSIEDTPQGPRLHRK